MYDTQLVTADTAATALASAAEGYTEGVDDCPAHGYRHMHFGLISPPLCEQVGDIIRWSNPLPSWANDTTEGTTLPDAIIANLREQLAASEAERTEANLRCAESVSTAVEAVKAEVRTITNLQGRLLVSTAGRHEWCDEFETYCEQITHSHMMPTWLVSTWEEATTRNREYTVTVPFTVTLTGSHSVTVTAADHDDAAEEARAILDGYGYEDIRYDVSTYDAEVEWDESCADIDEA